MFFSIIIPTFNREEDLCNTIKQLWEQTYKNFQIIVVDQSTSHLDKTSQFLNKAADNNQIILHNEPVPNAARARNIGVSFASGDIMLFLDDDVLFEADFLDSHLEMYKDPHCHAVQGYVHDRAGKRLYSETIELKLEANETVRFINLPGGNFSILKSAFDAIGGFDERFVYASTHEDKDFSLRFSRAEFHAVVAPQASLIHLLSIGGGRDKKKEDLLPRKQRLIAQFYFHLKNTKGLPCFITMWRFFRLYVFNWYRCKHPILLVKSFIVFCFSYFLALKLKHKKDFDPADYS